MNYKPVKGLAANQRERPTFLRANPLRGGVDELQARLSAEGVAHSIEPFTGLVRVEERYAPPDSQAFPSARMLQVSGAIRSWGVIRVLPVKGPEEARLIPEPCDKQNVSLEHGAVKLFL